MTFFIEQLIARAWNQLKAGPSHPVRYGMNLGHIVAESRVTDRITGISDEKRAEHVAVLGKTGTGKSSLLRHMAAQDIRRSLGFCFFDLHGDATSAILRLVAQEEQYRNQDLSDRLIVIEPADTEYSVGLNVLEQRNTQQSFVLIAEFAQILKQRWRLDTFGARTEELLRNALHMLSDNNLTLLELAPLLTNYAFRSSCLRRTVSPDVKDYFQSRYDRATEAMQTVFRDAILNKVSTFTADLHFRHILGQPRSTFSLLEAIDRGLWIILNLDKGRLGEQATTLGSLFLTKLKNALFARHNRRLFTLYCDEIQNLVTIDSGLDTLISEARKFGISLVTANQFLDQYPAHMRSAILAVASHVFFQLSSTDADKIASALDGGRSLAELLKNLPKRQMVVKIGHHRWLRAEVPLIEHPRGEYTDLYNRCRQRWAKRRADLEEEIRQRHAAFTRTTKEVLHDWE